MASVVMHLTNGIYDSYMMVIKLNRTRRRTGYRLDLFLLLLTEMCLQHSVSKTVKHQKLALNVCSDLYVVYLFFDQMAADLNQHFHNFSLYKALKRQLFSLPVNLLTVRLIFSKMSKILKNIVMFSFTEPKGDIFTLPTNGPKDIQFLYYVQ